MSAIGLTIGTLGATYLTKALSGFLFGISPTDLPTFGAVIAMLGSVAVMASLIPAIKAVRTNPTDVMRAE